MLKAYFSKCLLICVCKHGRFITWMRVSTRLCKISGCVTVCTGSENTDLKNCFWTNHLTSDMQSHLNVAEHNVTIGSGKKKRATKLTKLPIYILKILNFIPWITDSKLLLLTTVFFHVLGVAAFTTLAYGTWTNLTTLNGIQIPKMLLYSVQSSPYYQAVHVFVFVYMHWKCQKYKKSIFRFDEMDITRMGCWSSRQIVMLMLLFVLCLFTVVRGTFLLFSALLHKDNLDVALVFLENDQLKQALKYFLLGYYSYILIGFYMFPPLLGNFCYNLSNMVHKSTQQLLHSTDLKKFVMDLYEIDKLVSETNDYFCMNMATYVVASVHNVIVFIYFIFVFQDCGFSKLVYSQIACDCLCVAITLHLASAVHTMVKWKFRKFWGCFSFSVII